MMIANQHHRKRRLLIVFTLGFSSGLPYALLAGTLQAWFSDTGMPLVATGMLSLIGLPYVYRFFWGPILDRYPLTTLGKRRSWMLFAQIALFIGFNWMAWLSPNSSPKLLALIAFFLACCSATQDIAIDAHRTEYLPQEEHGLGASLATLGYRLALLASGGFALIIAQHWGWSMAYRFMGLGLLFGILATLRSPEPSIPETPQLNVLNSFIKPVQDLLKRQHCWALFLFIYLFKLGEAFTSISSGIVMPFLIQYIGFSLATIAWVNKIVGLGAVVTGGLLAGFLLLRWSLFRALLVFGALQALANIAFIALATTGKSTTLLVTAVVAANFATGLGSTALVAFFMRIVNRQFTASQFSMLVAIAMLALVTSGPIAVALQSIVGWVGVYEFSFIGALLFIPFLFKIQSYIQPDEQPEAANSGCIIGDQAEK